MSFELGEQTEFDDANSIADPVALALASAITLPKTKGVFWQMCALLTEPIAQRAFKIYNRTQSTRNGTTGAWADGVATTNLPITAAAGLIQGLVLEIEDEIVQIKSVNTTANTIDVVARGVAGTTGVAHSDLTEFTVIGSAINDTDLKTLESVNEVTGEYENFFQTAAEVIDYTQGADYDETKGLSEPKMTILQKEAMYRVAEGIAVASIRGKKQKGAKNGVAWMTAGLLIQLKSDAGGLRPVLTYDVNGVLTETKLIAALEEVFTRGTPDKIFCSFANKRTINQWLVNATNAIKVNTTLDNTTAGAYVDTYNYEGNLLEVHVDIDMPDAEIAVVNMMYCRKGWKANDGIKVNKEPSLSSREHSDSITGSFGLVIEQVGYEHILLTGITQS